MHNLSNAGRLGMDMYALLFGEDYDDIMSALIAITAQTIVNNCDTGCDRLEALMTAQAVLEDSRELMPEDTRDFTGRYLGDPIPGDPRRELLQRNR
jgi:hypothetical protein